jgi:hypothetical protein
VIRGGRRSGSSPACSPDPGRGSGPGVGCRRA